jgi:hypothetical protein
LAFVSGNAVFLLKSSASSLVLRQKVSPLLYKGYSIIHMAEVSVLQANDACEYRSYTAHAVLIECELNL